MNVPPAPTLVDLHEGEIELLERISESIHLTGIHTTPEGERARFAGCPSEPCRTWQQLLAMWTRFQSGRLP